MQFMERLSFGIVTIALLATLTTLLAPKAVHALVATLIRDVDSPGRAAQVIADCAAPSGIGGFFNCTPNYTVPANDRLVIQQVEGNCLTPQGKTLTNTLFVVNIPVPDQYGNTEINHQLPLFNEGPDWASAGRLLFANSQAVNYYADPGSTFHFFGDTNDFTDNTGCTFQFTGYLISYP